MVQRNDAALLLVTPTPHQPLINDGNPLEQQNTFKVESAYEKDGGSNVVESSSLGSPSAWILYQSIGDLAQSPPPGIDANRCQDVYVSQAESVTLLENSKVFISPGEVKKHEFKLSGKNKNLSSNESTAAVIVAVTVSILFQGSTSPITRGQIPLSFGHLKGNLFHADSHENVGFEAPQLQSLNTSKSIGRIFIQYKPNRLDESLVLIVEACNTDVHYSLSVTGRIAINVVKAIEVALTTTQGIKQKMKCIKQQPTGDLITTVDQVEILRRELKILRKQILMAKKSLNDCETKLRRARQDILDGDANDTLSEVERNALFVSVQGLITERKLLIDIFQYRVSERNRVCSEISSLNTKEKGLRCECENLEKQYLKDLTDILNAAHACWGSQAASRIELFFEGSQDEDEATITDCTMIGHVPDMQSIAANHLTSKSGSQITNTTTSEDCGMHVAASRYANGTQEVHTMYLKQLPDGLICKEVLNLEGLGKERRLRNDKKGILSRTCGSRIVSGRHIGSQMTLSEKLKTATDVQYSQNFQHIKRNCKDRVRFLLAEERRAADHSEPFIDCHAMHNMPQRFPTNVSVVALQAEINCILTELLLEKEEIFLSSRSSSSSYQSNTMAAYDSSDSDIDSSIETVIDHSRNVETSTMVLLPEQQYHGGIDEWKPYADIPVILERQDQLHKEIYRLQNLRMTSSPDLKTPEETTQEKNANEVEVQMALSVLRGGKPRMKIADAIKEMRWEHAELQIFKTQMRRDDAIIAVNSTINELVKRIVVTEVFDDLLEGMLAGWIFGQRTSEIPVAGNVPSLKTYTQLRPGDRQRVVSWLDINTKRRAKASSLMQEESGVVIPSNIHGTILEKSYAGPNTTARERCHAQRKKKEKQEHQHQLNNVELSLQHGTIALVLGYLKSISRLHCEQNSWNCNSRQQNPASQPSRTPERIKMMLEDENRLKRQERYLTAMNIAKRGEVMIQNRKRIEAIESMRRSLVSTRETTSRTHSIYLIQRVLRGYFGRKRARRRAKEALELKALMKVWNNAALFIQCIYRGYLGRCIAKELRMELAEFMASIRIEEAETDIAEFVSRKPTTWRMAKK